MPSWWQAVRRRPAVFILLLLVSTAATAVAVSGPLLTRAVGQSSVAGAVAGADLSDRSVVVSADVGEPFLVVKSRTQALLTLSTASTPGLGDPWTTPTIAFRSTDNLSWRTRSGKELSSRWATSDDGCAAYVLTSGRCPRGNDEVLLASTDQTRSAWRVGDVVKVRHGVDQPREFTVVGLYDPARSTDAPLVRPGTNDGVLAFVTAETLVIDESTAENDFAAQSRVVGRMTLRSVLGEEGESVVRDGLTTLGQRLVSVDVVYTLDTGVPFLLDAVDNQLASARILVLVSALQGLALALFAVVIMTAQLARVRAPEWGIGRLQGVSRARWWATVYLEPLLPLLLGVPAGLAVAGAAAQFVIIAELRPGTTLELWRAPVLVAAGVAGLVAVGALIVVSLPVLRSPLADLVQQRTEAVRPSRAALVLQAMVIVLALVTGYQVAAGGGLAYASTPLGLLAPGLFALAAALVAVRAATFVVRRTTRQRPRGLTGLVVGRRIARIPSALQPSLVVSVGVALAVLSGQVAAVSERNQDLRADATVGAQSVLRVSGASTTAELLAAVAAADPSGRYAMAAEEVVGESVGGTSRIVAVDTDRFAAVTRWHLAWGGVSDLATVLAGTRVAPLVLQGTQVRLDLTGQVENLNPERSGVDPQLSMVVEASGRWETVGLGSVDTAGARGSRSARLPAGCRTGCRLVALTLEAGASDAYQATATIDALRTDGQPAATTDGWLRDKTYWRSAAIEQVADAVGSALPSTDDSGLTIVANSISGSTPVTVRTGDVPDPVPALLGPAVPTPPVVGAPGDVTGTGLDGQVQLLAQVGTAAVLPRSLGDGVLVDLRVMASASDPRFSAAVQEVWLATGAPADLPDRLAAAGLTVTDRDDLGPVREGLRDQAMTRGAALAAGIGIAGLLLALVALVAGRVIGAEQRRSDWQIVRRAGVGPGRLRALAVVEVAGPALLGVLLGAVAGLVTVWKSAAQLPLVDLTAYGPPLDLRPDWAALIQVVGASALVVLLVALVAATLETRGER